MPKTSKSKATASYSFLLPIAQAFISAGAHRDSIFSKIQSTADATRDQSLPLALVYKAANTEAENISKLTLGFDAGTIFARRLLDEVLIHKIENKSLSAIFIEISSWIANTTSGTPLNLGILGDTAILSQVRKGVTAMETAQGDAFTLGALITIIKLFVGSEFDKARISVAISKSNLVPVKVIPPRCVKPYAHSGVALELPLIWLESVMSEPDPLKDQATPGPSDFVSAFQKMIENVVEDKSPSLEQAAALLEFSPRELQSALKAEGTTFTKVITAIKCEYAKDKLASDMMISSISEDMGYSDYSAFSRAFKTWTGFSPEEFRSQLGG